MDKEQLIGYIKANDIHNHQFVYGGLNYGTFYVIFLKLETYDSGKYIKSIEFKLHNYKGLINLNFFKFKSLKASFTKYNIYIDTSLNGEILRINTPVKWTFKKKYKKKVDVSNKKILVKSIRRINLNREYITILNPKKNLDEIKKILDKMEKDIHTDAVGLNCGQSKMLVAP